MEPIDKQLDYLKDYSEAILNLAIYHRETWRNKHQWFWFLSLLEEVLELGLSLLGLHKDRPEHELKQIAAICINWWDYRHQKRWQGILR